MAMIYPNLWLSTAGNVARLDEHTQSKVPTETFLFWYAGIRNLADEDLERAYAECERKSIADEGNGRKIFPPSLAIFTIWAKHGNKARGSAGISHTDFSDPMHPSNDPNSVEYTGRMSSDKRKRIGNPEQMEKEKASGNSAIKNILEGL